jgi:Pyridoxamine 5'-phosphate oxidase
MSRKEPTAELDSQFSSDDATPIPWVEGRERPEGAEVYWISSVRPDGRPHVTPLLSVWLDGTLYFCTGPDERKAKNLVRNPHRILTTGCNALDEGLDVVDEGDAVRVTDDAKLGRVTDAYLSKYGSDWRFAVLDGDFYHDLGSLRETDMGAAWVYEVSPKKVFGFGKGEEFSQTRWRF